MATTKNGTLVTASGTLGDAYDGWETDSINVAAFDQIAVTIDLAWGTATEISFKFQESDGEDGDADDDHQDVMAPDADGNLVIEEITLADDSVDGKKTFKLNTSCISRLKILGKVNADATSAAISSTRIVAEAEENKSIATPSFD